MVLKTLCFSLIKFSWGCNGCFPDTPHTDGWFNGDPSKLGMFLLGVLGILLFYVGIRKFLQAVKNRDISPEGIIKKPCPKE